MGDPVHTAIPIKYHFGDRKAVGVLGGNTQRGERGREREGEREKELMVGLKLNTYTL